MENIQPYQEHTAEQELCLKKNDAKTRKKMQPEVHSLQGR